MDRISFSIFMKTDKKELEITGKPVDDVLFEEYKDKEYPHGLKYFCPVYYPQTRYRQKI